MTRPASAGRNSPQPAEAATSEAADLPPGLVYVSDASPGIRRVRKGRGFAYFAPDGKVLREPETLRRIKSLAIPPAYATVWICPLANGHLQATGRDARGRKQYRYHPLWNASREIDKFARLEAFGLALPRIRQRVGRDLRAAEEDSTVTRPLVLATVVRLLDTTFVRIGNEEYARENGSYGLTTLERRHAGVRGETIRLSFRGKSGVLHRVTVDDRRVARVVRRCQDLPGQSLFHYEDPDGTVHGIGSGDVNDYLAEAAGERFTAKDFRTWHGTVQALELTRLACGAGTYNAQAVLKEVAGLLGNTVAVCRKAYIHPAVLELGKSLTSRSERLESEDAAALWAGLEGPVQASGLRAAERRLLAFLQARTGKVSAPPDPALPASRR